MFNMTLQKLKDHPITVGIGIFAAIMGAVAGLFYLVQLFTSEGNPRPNGIPSAVSDNYNVLAGQTLTVPVASGVLQNDSDPDDDNLTAVQSTNASSGILTLNQAGSFTYIPDSGFEGTDSFIYEASAL